jgi:hypothetical protein
MPVFDNNCFSPASLFFIPSFKNLRKPVLSNNKATSHRSGNEGPGEQEAHEKLRARKEQLRKAADNNIVIKYDKFYAANLLSRPSPTPLIECDSTVTVIAHTQPPPPPLSTDTNPHPTPPSEQAQHKHIALQTPTPTPSEPNQSQWDNQTNGQEQREGPTRAGVRNNETERHERVAGEVEAGQGKQPPPHTTLIEHDREHDSDNMTSAHEVVHAATLAVKPPPDDRVPGENNPTPPGPDPPPQMPPTKPLVNDVVPGQTTPTASYPAPVELPPPITATPPLTTTHCMTAGSMCAELHKPTHPLLNNMPARLRGRGARTPQLPQPPSITAGSMATMLVYMDSGILSHPPPNPSQTMQAHVLDPHLSQTSEGSSTLSHTRTLLIRNHHHGRSSTSGTTCAPWLTPSLVSALPLGPTSAVVTAKFQVTSFHTSFASDLFLGRPLNQFYFTRQLRSLLI